MKRKRPSVCSMLMLILVALTSCISQKGYNFKSAPLYGMLYDYENQPCSAAQIMVDGRLGPNSDINGRFIIPDLTKGSHKIGINKPGFEPIEVDFDFMNRTQVLYLKIISLNYLLKQTELSLELRKFKEARDFLNRAELINNQDPVLLFLKAIYLIKNRREDEALTILEELIAHGVEESAIYLALSDIYQFYLNDPAKTKYYINKALEIQDNPYIRQRLEKLP